MRKSVLLIGWHPDVVEYSKWPGLTAEKLLSALTSDRDRLAEIGYDAELCLIRDSNEGPNTVADFLGKKAYDCVLIGAGVRTDSEHFHVFETLVNTVHEKAPAAKICFNTGPTDSVDAVKRWV